MHGQVLPWKHQDQIDLDSLIDWMVLAADILCSVDVLLRVEDCLQFGQVQVISEQVGLEALRAVDQLWHRFL